MKTNGLAVLQCSNEPDTYCLLPVYCCQQFFTPRCGKLRILMTGVVAYLPRQFTEMCLALFLYDLWRSRINIWLCPWWEKMSVNVIDAVILNGEHLITTTSGTFSAFWELILNCKTMQTPSMKSISEKIISGGCTILYDSNDLYIHIYYLIKKHK